MSAPLRWLYERYRTASAASLHTDAHKPGEWLRVTPGSPEATALVAAAAGGADAPSEAAGAVKRLAGDRLNDRIGVSTHQEIRLTSFRNGTSKAIFVRFFSTTPGKKSGAKGADRKQLPPALASQTELKLEKRRPEPGVRQSESGGAAPESHGDGPLVHGDGPLVHGDGPLVHGDGPLVHGDAEPQPVAQPVAPWTDEAIDESILSPQTIPDWNGRDLSWLLNPNMIETALGDVSAEYDTLTERAVDFPEPVDDFPKPVDEPSPEPIEETTLDAVFESEEEYSPEQSEALLSGPTAKAADAAAHVAADTEIKIPKPEDWHTTSRQVVRATSALVKRYQSETGKLAVLCPSPGTGKTYAMVQAAVDEQQAGRRVAYAVLSRAMLAETRERIEATAVKTKRTVNLHVIEGRHAGNCVEIESVESAQKLGYFPGQDVCPGCTKYPPMPLIVKGKKDRRFVYVAEARGEVCGYYAARIRAVMDVERTQQYPLVYPHPPMILTTHAGLAVGTTVSEQHGQIPMSERNNQEFWEFDTIFIDEDPAGAIETSMSVGDGQLVYNKLDEKTGLPDAYTQVTRLFRVAFELATEERAQSRRVGFKTRVSKNPEKWAPDPVHKKREHGSDYAGDELEALLIRAADKLGEPGRDGLLKFLNKISNDSNTERSREKKKDEKKKRADAKEQAAAEAAAAEAAAAESAETDLFGVPIVVPAVRPRPVTTPEKKERTKESGKLLGLTAEEAAEQFPHQNLSAIAAALYKEAEDRRILERDGKHIGVELAYNVHLKLDVDSREPTKTETVTGFVRLQRAIAFGAKKANVICGDAYGNVADYERLFQRYRRVGDQWVGNVDVINYRAKWPKSSVLIRIAARARSSDLAAHGDFTRHCDWHVRSIMALETGRRLLFYVHLGLKKWFEDWLEAQPVTATLGGYAIEYWGSGRGKDIYRDFDSFLAVTEYIPNVGGLIHEANGRVCRLPEYHVGGLPLRIRFAPKGGESFTNMITESDPALAGAFQRKAVDELAQAVHRIRPAMTGTGPKRCWILGFHVPLSDELLAATSATVTHNPPPIEGEPEERGARFQADVGVLGFVSKHEAASAIGEVYRTLGCWSPIFAHALLAVPECGGMSPRLRELLGLEGVGPQNVREERGEPVKSSSYGFAPLLGAPNFGRLADRVLAPPSDSTEIAGRVRTHALYRDALSVFEDSLLAPLETGRVRRDWMPLGSHGVSFVGDVQRMERIIDCYAPGYVAPPF